MAAQHGSTNKHGSSNKKGPTEGGKIDDLIEDFLKYLRCEDNEVVRKSVEKAVQDPLSLMDMMISVMEFMGDDPDTAKHLLDMAELRLATLVKNAEIYGVIAKHELTPEEKCLNHAFTARQVLSMWRYRKEHLIITPIDRIYTCMEDFITDVANDNDFSRQKASAVIQQNEAGYYQFVEGIGLFVYAKDD